MGTLITDATPAQMKALAIVPKVSSVLSLLGSFYIVFDFFRISARNRRLYHRILLGMSSCDLVSSTAFFLSTWPIPPDVFPAAYARGTQATCTAQGFFTQFSVAIVFYNGFLTLYYLLVIRFGWTEQRLRKSRVELMMHVVPISMGLITSSVCAAKGMFNPLPWDCWIVAAPLGCNESYQHGGVTTCDRGDNATLYQWGFFYGPLWTIVALVGLSMVIIIRHFHQQEEKTHQYHTPHNKRTQQIKNQAICYVGAFFLTWTFPTILRINESTSTVASYHWVLMSCMFVPTQGLLNALIYLRPRYLRVAKRRRAQQHQREQQQRAAIEDHPAQGHNVIEPDTDMHIPTTQSSSLASHDPNTIGSIQPHEPVVPVPPGDGAFDNQNGVSTPQQNPSHNESTSQTQSWFSQRFLDVQYFWNDFAEAIVQGDQGFGMRRSSTTQSGSASRRRSSLIRALQHHYNDDPQPLDTPEEKEEDQPQPPET